MRDLLSGMFVFFQTYDQQPEGTRLAGSYRLMRFPATLVIDPLTGACLPLNDHLSVYYLCF